MAKTIMLNGKKITIRREKWGRRYRIVARDERGRYIRWSEWKPSRGLTLQYLVSGFLGYEEKHEIENEEYVYKYELFVKVVPRTKKRSRTPEWVFAIRFVTWSEEELSPIDQRMIWERAKKQILDLRALFMNKNFTANVREEVTIGSEERPIPKSEVPAGVPEFPDVAYVLEFWNGSGHKEGVIHVY